MGLQSLFRNFQERANIFSEQEASSALSFEIATKLESAKLYDLAQPPRDDVTGTVITSRDAESLTPLIAQGFLLDVAHYKGGQLADDYAITAEDLDGAMKAQGRLIMPGGIILLRTGAGQFWSDPARYAKAARLSPEANQWILGKHPRAVGADIPTWDMSNEPESIDVLTNLNLEGLAADHADHFLFIAAPIKWKGAMSSPVRPLAIEIQAQADAILP